MLLVDVTNTLEPCLKILASRRKGFVLLWARVKLFPLLLSSQMELPTTAASRLELSAAAAMFAIGRKVA